MNDWLNKLVSKNYDKILIPCFPSLNATSQAMDVIFDWSVNLFLCVSILVLLLLIQNKDVRPIPDYFLLRTHGLI